MNLDTEFLNAILDDYAVVDGLVDLTIYRPSTDETWTGVQGISFIAKEEEAGSPLRVQAERQWWHIFAKSWDDVPKPGDEITDSSGVTWIANPEDNRAVFQNVTVGVTAIVHQVRCIRKK